MHTLIKEFAIRRVEHKSETHSNESQHLAEGTGSSTSSAANFFSFTVGTFIPHASPSLQTGGGTCEHPTAPFARSDACTSASYRGVTGSEGQEGANGVEGEIGVGGGNGDGNGLGGGNGDGAGAGAGTGTERERERERGWR